MLQRRNWNSVAVLLLWAGALSMRGGGSAASSSDVASRRQPRYALLLCGAVSRVYHHGSSLTPQSHHIYMGKSHPFTPVEVTGSSVMKHIVEANGGPDHVDTFIHCWNREVESRLRLVYKASLRTALFEDNRPVQRKEVRGVRSNARQPSVLPNRFFVRSDWRQVSWAISISRAVEMMVASCKKSNAAATALGGGGGGGGGGSQCYDAVIIYRPDVMLLRDLNVSALSPPQQPPQSAKGQGRQQTAFVGHWMHGHGDLHLVLPYAAAVRFGETVLPYLRRRDNAKPHAWLPGFLKQHLRLAVAEDQLRPGWDEEVYRKIPWAEDMSCHGKAPYEPYGMTQELWDQLGRMEYRNCSNGRGTGGAAGAPLGLPKMRGRGGNSGGI